MKRLTAKFAESISQPGKYYDGDAGLYLHVQERNGRIRKSYMQRVTVRGRRVEIGLGSVKWTTPSEARVNAQANRKIARTNGDPRDRTGGVPTFAAALDKVLDVQRPTWRNGGKSEAQWRASLRDYAGGLMNRPVNEITTADVLAVLVPIWNTKRETARRVRQRIGAVCKWAIAEGHRGDNPAGEAVGAALPKNGAKLEHFRALPHDRVRDALICVRGSGAWWATIAAFEFLVLTAARSGEVRGMEWNEVDPDAAIWMVPAERMKAGREHRVPLSPQAVAILEDAQERTGGAGLVFPSVTGRKMSDSTLSKLAKELGIEGTPHGMRSAFRDWASERTNTPHAVMEASLAHIIRDKAEAAYARSDLLDKRKKLMDAWGAYLDGEGGRVVAIG